MPLLQVEEYRSPLLEGALLATVSMGGDEVRNPTDLRCFLPSSQNQHSSSTPFLDYLLLLPPTSVDPSDYSLLQALRDLHSVARRNFSANRIFVPFLFILSSLAEAGALEEIVSEESGEGEKCVKSLLAIATNSVQKMKAPQRVGASSKV